MIQTKLFSGIIFALLFLNACTTALQKNVSQATPSPDYYSEPHRPQFHFSPERKWMNDPNGLVYYKGQYHLFYQYYPDSTVWGPMHWGHAVSTDLSHWNHLPIALYPDSLGLIFSGSVVVDENNTAGLQKGDEKTLVAIFTLHSMAGEKAGKTNFQNQGMAYSNDGGMTWVKYAQNPIIRNPGIKDFRDPKVFWHQPSKQWVMTLAVADRVHFYGSTNLRDWNKVGEFGIGHGSHGGVWECPDLFPIKIAGTEREKWVLIQSIGNGAPNGGSGTQYFVGDFDGKTFKNDNPKDSILWLDYGRDNYAGVTWSGIPSKDGRRLFLGWMSNWQYATHVPTEKWRSAMTLPRTLSLHDTPHGLRIYAEPVKELQSLRRNEKTISVTNIRESLDVSSGSKTAEYLLDFDLNQTTANDLGLELANSKGEKVRIGFEKQTNRLYIDRTNAGNTDFSKEFAGRHYAPHADSSGVLHLSLIHI